jgi:hypothetical protein
VHRATTLNDGRVLLSGGCSTAGCGGVEDAAETAIFDPATDSTVAGPTLHQPRLSHTATLLEDGRVLIAGGYGGEGEPPTASIEIFDPVDDSLTRSRPLEVARADHSASLLPDGTVLIAGGQGVSGAALRSAEVVHPSSGEVTSAANLPQPRTAHAAAAVGRRVVLIGGTTTGDDAVGSSVVYDSRSGTWSPGPALRTARVKHAAIALPSGGILVVGGSKSAESRRAFASTEMLDPALTRFTTGPSLPDGGRYKLTAAAAVLPDGRVAVAGGETVDVIDPTDKEVRVISSPSLGTTRAFQTLNVLSDGQVLVAGGYDGGIVPTGNAWVVQAY